MIKRIFSYLLLGTLILVTGCDDDKPKVSPKFTVTCYSSMEKKSYIFNGLNYHQFYISKDSTRIYGNKGYYVVNEFSSGYLCHASEEVNKIITN